MVIQYKQAETELELKQILALQKANLASSLTQTEIQSQGFVTVSHSFELMADMNAKCPHIIAKHNNQVIGYALVMLESFKNRIPILVPMFEQIKTIDYEGKMMDEIIFFIMGQVCIARDFRGKGVFKGLFDKMKTDMALKFQMVVTEVATRNQRSLNAHAKIGFKTIKEYVSEEGEEWVIIAWDWK